MNESFVFYRSFAEALEELPPEQYKEVMTALTKYALDGTLPDNMDPVLKGYFVLMKPQVDANNSKRENGRKGGSTPKQTEAKEGKAEAKESKRKQTEANAKQTEANVNANANDMKEKDTPNGVSKEKHRHGAFSHVLLTDQEEQKLIADYGADKAKTAIDYLDEYIERKGYSSKSHYLAIRKWVFDAIREEQIKHQEMQQREQRIENFKHPMNPPAKPQQGMQRDEDLDAMLISQIAGRSSNEHMDYMPQERGAGYVPIGFGP